MAVNSRPLPATVEPSLTAAKCSTPLTSVVSHADPAMSVPSRHLSTTVALEPMMLPVRDASTALRTVLSVLIWMLNPLSGSEPVISTWIISWLPWEAKSTGGDAGQVVADAPARQTRPVRACALGIAAGRTGSIEMISRGIMTSSFGFFNLVLHRFSIGGYSRSLNIRVSGLRDRSVAEKR